MVLNKKIVIAIVSILVVLLVVVGISLYIWTIQNPVPSQPALDNLSEEQKVNMLDELAGENTATTSSENKLKTLNNLSAESGSTVSPSDEAKIKLLESLKN